MTIDLIAFFFLSRVAFLFIAKDILYYRLAKKSA